MKRGILAVLASAGLVAAASPAAAAVIFSTDFNGYSTPNGYATQYQTGLRESYGGTESGFTASGFHAVHAADRTGNGDWAVMLYNGTNGSDTNSLTTTSAILANSLGVTYLVSFQAAGAVYGSASEATVAGDGIGFILANSSGVVSEYTYATPAFGGANTPS